MPTDEDVDNLGDPDTRIKLRKEKRRGLCSVMETARKAFVAAAADALVSWYETTAAQVVRADPRKAEELSRDGRLGQLKAQLQELVKGTDAAVEQDLSREGLFEMACRPPVQPRAPSPSLDAPIQRIAGRLDDLLGHYGLPSSEPRSFTWPDPMHEALSRYRDAWQQIRELEEAIATDRREEGEAEAQSLWDKA